MRSSGNNRGSGFVMNDVQKRSIVRKAVDKLSKSRTVAFMPDLIMKQTELEYNDVLKYLNELTCFNGVLKTQYRFICPNFQCSNMQTYKHLSDIPNEMICPVCGRELPTWEICGNTYLMYKFKKGK